MAAAVLDLDAVEVGVAVDAVAVAAGGVELAGVVLVDDVLQRGRVAAAGVVGAAPADEVDGSVGADGEVAQRAGQVAEPVVEGAACVALGARIDRGWRSSR
jgi:hypothetical protein